jgi:hypothetical protein
VLVPLGRLSARVASIEDLLRMKRLAGRDVDMLAIRALEAIRRRSRDDGRGR